MREYKRLVRKVLKANPCVDSQGKTTYNVFGDNVRLTILKCLPFLTLRHISPHIVKNEFIWTLKGSTTLKYLHDQSIHAFDKYANDGKVGEYIPTQWRSVPTNKGKQIDQLREVIEGIRQNPTSRRHILTHWNVASLANMCKLPCAVMCQFYVCGESLNQLSMSLYLRSVDVYEDFPYEIAMYGLLLQFVAHLCEMQALDLFVSFGNLHIHEENVKECKRLLRRKEFEFPSVRFTNFNKNLDSYEAEHIVIENYKAHRNDLEMVVVL